MCTSAASPHTHTQCFETVRLTGRRSAREKSTAALRCPLSLSLFLVCHFTQLEVPLVFAVFTGSLRSHFSPPPPLFSHPLLKKSHLGAQYPFRFIMDSSPSCPFVFFPGFHWPVVVSRRWPLFADAHSFAG